MRSKTGLALQSAWAKRLSLASGSTTGAAAAPCIRVRAEAQSAAKD